VGCSGMERSRAATTARLVGWRDYRSDGLCGRPAGKQRRCTRTRCVPGPRVLCFLFHDPRSGNQSFNISVNRLDQLPTDGTLSCERRGAHPFEHGWPRSGTAVRGTRTLNHRCASFLDLSTHIRPTASIRTQPGARSRRSRRCLLQRHEEKPPLAWFAYVLLRGVFVG
jgi:hypothetical protein